MAPNPFTPYDDNPKYKLKAKGEDFFLSPGKTERGVIEIVQGHHINPNNIVDRQPSVGNLEERLIADLFTRLKQVGYRQDDPLRNRVYLASNAEDALRMGSALHDNSHPEYDNFMEEKYLEITQKAEYEITKGDFVEGSDGFREVYLRADRDMNGLQQSVKELLQGTDEFGRPLLVLNQRDADLRGLGESAVSINERANASFKIYVFGDDGGPIPGELRARETFLKGLLGVENGNYGHSLDFTPDGAG
jgi:A nuclease family of the HNH/ENDO VII superfamily with conserved AHH